MKTMKTGAFALSLIVLSTASFASVSSTSGREDAFGQEAISNAVASLIAAPKVETVFDQLTLGLAPKRKGALQRPLLGPADNLDASEDIIDPFSVISR